VKTIKDKVVRHSLAYLSMQKWRSGSDIALFHRIR